MALIYEPQVGQTLQATRDNIRNNFVNIDTSFDINHFPINSGADEGKHKFVVMPVANPIPTTGANEIALYSLVDPLTTAPELYLKRASDSAIIPMTEKGQNGLRGWTYLPSGIVMKWGRIPIAATATDTDFFEVGPGDFTAIYTVQVTGEMNALVPTTKVTLTGYNLTSVTYVNTGNQTATAHYFVIGVV